MSILCKICSKEFEKQITNSHLRTHNLTTTEYKNVYGEDSLTCTIYKSLLAEKRSGSNNPNFNKKWDPTMKKNMSELKKGSVPWNKGKFGFRSKEGNKIASEKMKNKWKDPIYIRKQFEAKNQKAHK